MWITNIAAQFNHISFEESTSLTFQYIGTKPDSIPGSKAAGYYRWVPKVTYATQTVPTTTVISGESTTGTIGQQMYAPASGYEYVHDQGGGGK